MKKVYKYRLDVTDEQFIELPKGAEILSVAEQRDDVVLYVLIDTTVTETEPRTIYVHGTGHNVFGENLRFIGTVKLYEGSLMFHVFEEVSKCPV